MYQMDNLDTKRLEATAIERGQEEMQHQPQSSPLFPLCHRSSDLSPALPESSEATKWLNNPSFTFDVSTVPATVVPSFPMVSTLEDSDKDGPEAPKNPSYEPVPSSSSSDLQRHSELKEKKRRRMRKRHKLGYESSRKSGVRAWIGSDTKPGKDYYFDVHGDRDNLAFGCLYRMDIVRYKFQNHSDLSEVDFELLCHRRSSIFGMDIDHDLDVLDTKLKVGGRYYSVKFTALERYKGFKHIKIIEKKPSLIPGEYLPLVELHTTIGNDRNELNRDVKLEESWEDELLRRTRELNKMSRDFPHDEKVWLAFAEFQDKIASTQSQKAARLQTLEKKISILEKAIDLNPDNEELLLFLLKSYRERDTTETLVEKWGKMLVRHYDSVMLWKAYLLVRQGEFSHFKVTDIRKAYSHAIQALSSACNKLCGQDYQAYNFKCKDSSLVELELGLVDIFVNLCRFEWQTGHQELATGLFQAEIEYSLFCPSLLLSLHSKQKLFEHFWNSSGARLGEDGALGWSIWLEKEHNRKDTICEEIVEESEGGWSGWMDRFPKEPTPKEEISEEQLDIDNTEDNLVNGGIPLNDDVEDLLKKLGIDVDADPLTEVKDTATWKKWSQEELSRDSAEWMPIRGNPGNCGSLSSPYHEDIQDMNRNEQLSRVILFEDVNEYLFSLCSNEARYSLVSQFVEFFGGKISCWTCTNNATWMEKVLSLESLEDSTLEDLRAVSRVCNRDDHSAPSALESLLGRKNDMFRNTSAMKFLRNAILLCLNAFPRNYILEEALIAAEELSCTPTSTSIPSNPSRSLAKSLLKNDRQDLLLCGVYARSEAAYGNLEIARKIFDMALSSANGLPMELKEHIPLLYLWYAEVELAACNSSSNTDQCLQRAVHILSCLGGNSKYTLFASQSSGLEILRARQGFKEQVKNLRSSWAHGDVTESSVVLIRSAFLFELLTSGWSASIQIIEEAFSMTLPERRSRSFQLESLWMHYISALQKCMDQLRFSRAWEVITQSLQMYPYNPRSFSAMVQVCSHFTSRHRVRQIFDEYMQRKPSMILWLFAFSFELGESGTEHRIHGLFEKAVANDILQKSVLLWRCYLAYETDVACNLPAAKRIFFRAIHACPWSKRLWLDGFQRLSTILTAKELSDLQGVMREKELCIRTDIYEILLQEDETMDP